MADHSKKHGKEKEPEAPPDDTAKGENLPATTGGTTDVTVFDFGDDVGAGMENVRRDERKIPFLTILDPKSPQCKPVSAGGVPGAKGGAFFNTATGEVYDGEKGIDFVPVYRDENYVEFIPKEPDGSGGGFVSIKSPTDPLVFQLQAKQGKFGKLVTSDKTELVQTYYLYGLLLNPDDGTPSPVMVAFKSTQIKKYQGFITRQDSIQYPSRDKDGKPVMVKPPLWSHVWHISTRYEQKGTFSWYGYVLRLRKEPSRESLIPRTDPLYQTGKTLYEAITSGSKTGDYAEAATKGPQSPDEEIPM